MSEGYTRVNEFKTCNTCMVEKSKTDFYKLSSNKKYIQFECKSCAIKRTTGWKKRNPGKSRDICKKANLKKNYGLSLDAYKDMLKKQENKCSICLSQFDSINIPHIDHCHKTGIVRGILCVGCNHGIGKLKDSVSNLLRAADYIKAFGSVTASNSVVLI